MKYIRVASNEKTEVNRWGGEKWDNVRAFGKVEVPVIHRNVLLSLPPMVSVLYMPGNLPRVMFSSWIAVDKSVVPWDKKSAENKDVDLLDNEEEPSALAGTTEKAIQGGSSIAKPKMRNNPNLKLPIVVNPLEVQESEKTQETVVKND